MFCIHPLPSVKENINIRDLIASSCIVPHSVADYRIESHSAAAAGGVWVGGRGQQTNRGRTWCHNAVRGICSQYFSVAILAQKHSAVTVALPLVSSPRIVAGHAHHWRASYFSPCPSLAAGGLAAGSYSYFARRHTNRCRTWCHNAAPSRFAGLSVGRSRAGRSRADVAKSNLCKVFGEEDERSNEGLSRYDVLTGGVWNIPPTLAAGSAIPRRILY